MSAASNKAAPAVAREWTFGSPIIAQCFNRRGDYVALALANGEVALIEASDIADEPKLMKLHDGISLSLAPDGDEHAFLSSGDDGAVYVIEPGLGAPTLVAQHKHKWIDHVASSVDGARAYSVGKKIHMLDDSGAEIAVHEVPSSPGGLSFAPNGKRLAASHYNGVSLFWLKSKESAPAKLEWKGSHLNLCWHPDGKIVMTSMQESALHGWRLADLAEMQMQGYAAKIHSMAFTAKGKFLATSGAEQVICWPYFGGGPWNKSPLTLGGTDGRLVTRVAPHPKDELVAAGYDDGMVILAPLDGRMEIMLHPPVAPGAGIVGLGWNATGDCLFAARADGTLLLFTLASVGRAMRS